ncbi:MAG TPA: TonB-dependent receptor [Marinagarivorans sp.]
MKYKVLAAAIALASVNADALEGTVVNKAGEPIAGAMVQGAGIKATSKQSATTDENGRFTLPDGAYELHVTAPGFSHRIVHIDENTAQQLTIRLPSTVIEQIDVIGIPLHASVIESAQPISVLSGKELRNRQAATLGDSLENEVGVHSSFHGNVASTPIIRGLSGPRVKITQNSLDVSDVSRVGPDHAVASEVSTAEQIEVLRGPATLFYGSGAIGGVVNVVDKRVPQDSDTRGEWLLSRETVNNQNLGSINVNTGRNNLAFHADVFWRESDDYKVPVAPELEQDHDHNDEHGGDYQVENSGEKSHGFTLGSSYLLDNGYVGVSWGQLNREYGIPGHSHGEQSVYADLEQDRLQMISELKLDHAWLSAVNTRVGYTDYSHSEIEGGNIGTVFSNTTSEVKLDVLHKPLHDWKGGIVLHYKHSDVEAVGAEAFTPPSQTQTLALAVVEERHFGDVLLQLGARVERVTISADNVLLPALDVHGHGDSDAHDEHDHGTEEHSEGTRVFASDQEFTPVSISAGAVWDFTPGYNVAFSYTHAERAPSASELLSFGPHIGSGSYEIGALFALHNDHGDAHFSISDKPFELETSNNIDLTFRKHEGDFGLLLNAFFNRVDNFYYQAATGLYAESGHSHDHGDHDHGGEGEHEDELPVYVFTSADAAFYGFEAQGIWQITPKFKTTLFGDYVKAELKDSNEYLPRTPPLRYGARFDYAWNSLSANLSWSRYDEQKNTAALETSTGGYDWLDAVVTWDLPIGPGDMALFAKVENISDTEARVHSSFLKDIAPKPGRNFSLGLRGTF